MERRDYKSRIAEGSWGSQKLGGAGKEPPVDPPEGARPCRHLGLLAPRTLRAQISVLLSHPVCGTFIRALGDEYIMLGTWLDCSVNEYQVVSQFS